MELVGQWPERGGRASLRNPGQELLTRLLEVRFAIEKPDESILKEKRQYAVRVNRSFIILSSILTSLTREPRLIAHVPVWQGLLLDHLRKLLFAGISELENDSDHIVTLSLSKRTYVPAERCTILVYLKRVLRDLRREHGRVATLSEVLGSMRKYELPSPEGITGDGFEEFLTDLRTILTDGQEVPVLESQSHLAFSKKWHGQPLAVLKQKFYLSRGDYRAYYVERDLARHLAGAIVVRVLLPKAKGRREKALFSRTYAVRDKDRLSITRILPSRHEARLLLGDISSFTASAIGSPALALLMWDLWQVEKADLPSTVVASVDGELVEVDVELALRVFIRRTVWAPVEIEGAPFVSTGGYLGLTGNINVTLTSFAFLIRVFRNDLGHHFPRVRLMFKLGGDDFCALLIGPVGEVDQAVESFKSFVTSYVGSLKFSHAIDPMIPCEASVGTYCKRQVFVSSCSDQNELTFSISTVENVPLPSQLFQDFSTMAPELVEDSAQAFFDSLQQMCSKGDVSDELVHEYLYILEEIQNRPLCVTTPRSFPRIPRFVITTESWCLTQKAYRAVCEVSSICLQSGRSVRVSFTNKLMLALSQESVAIRKVTDGLQVVSLVIAQNEMRLFRSDRVPLIIRRHPSWNLIPVLEVLKQIRSSGVEVES